MFCSCGGPYMMRNGDLACVKCGGLSPKAKFNQKTQGFDKLTAEDRERADKREDKKAKAAR